MMLKTIIAAGLWLLAVPAWAGWQVAETAHFRVYSQGPDASLRQQAAVLEDFRSLLVKMTNAPPIAPDAPKLDVFMLDRLAASQPYARIDRDIAGYYAAGSGRIAAFVETGEGGQATLLHEYAHHFMLASGAVAYPAWYIEGFAEYFMTATFRSERIEFGIANGNRVAWLLNEPWLPLERLISPTARLKTGSERVMFYAQSWLLTHYLFRAPGMVPKFSAYLKAVATGEPPVTAFKTHVDSDLPGLQGRLKRYLTSRSTTYSRYQRPPVTPASVTLSRLPASADRLLMPLTAVEMGLDVTERPQALAEIRRAAAAMPGDALAQRTLALVELRYGDRGAATAIIERLLAAAPDDATLLRWRAAALVAEDRPDAVRDARKLLARSFRTDPNDWRTLFGYAALYQPLRRRLDPPTLDVLLRAQQLAPQVEEIALTTSVALTRAERLPDAIGMLQSLAYAPHGGAKAERAAAMLAAARAGDAPGVLAAFARRAADDYDADSAADR